MTSSGDIRSVVFDTEANQIALATSMGFAIFESLHYQLLSSVRLLGVHPAFSQGARLISVLGSSNIVAVTPNPASNQVFIFDRLKGQELATINLGEQVNGIRLRPDILIAATAKKISVRSLSDFCEITAFETAASREGLFDVPATLASSLIAFPSPDTGIAALANYLDSSGRLTHVHACKGPIAFLKFSDNARLLAIAIEDGKNIAVFSVPSMRQIASLKRTVATPKVLSMSFEPHGTQLAVTSASGHLHVYFIVWNEGDQDVKKQLVLKGSDNVPAWVAFAPKTLKLGGVTTSGVVFKVQFDEQIKQASFEMGETLLWKPA
jgi:WD40 repeat protein